VPEWHTAYAPRMRKAATARLAKGLSLLILTACSTAESRPDAGPDPSRPVIGQVGIKSLRSKDGASAYGWSFFRTPAIEPVPPCSGEKEDGTSVETTPRDPGKISVEIGSQVVFSDLRSVTHVDEALWNGPGERIVIRSGGAEVPAFEGVVTSPAAIIVEPFSGFLSGTDAPVELTWSGGMPGDTVLVSSRDPGGYAWCEFPAEAGHGTIPADVVALAAEGYFDDEPTGGVVTVRRTYVDVGGNNVVLSAFSEATWPLGDLADDIY